MAAEGRYLHLTADRHREALDHAWEVNREQARQNLLAKQLRRVARAAEEYATALETGRGAIYARNQLTLAVDALNQVNRG